jgi:hypothetical protein
MKTRLVLKPGAKGTRKAVHEFGGKQLCVRYRYDEANRRRLKTAEFVLEEVPWEPGGGRKGAASRREAEPGTPAGGAAAVPTSTQSERKVERGPRPETNHACGHG